ncbi:MAG: hypothetical protein LBB46_05670, partial [Coriobacteriaceae bacterium]|nr:hypothetical protein [Coriobacteriaceae bacterium]
MKALVLAEGFEAAGKLGAGARGLADEVVCVVIGEGQIPRGVADKVIHVSLPQGAVYDDAADTVNAIFDAQAPELVFVEPTRHLKVIAGRLAAHAKTSVITDVLELGVESATNMYFGGVAHRRLKALGTAIYTINPET